MTNSFEEWRTSRLNEIRAGAKSLPTPLQEGPVAVLHLAPTMALTHSTPLELPSRKWLEGAPVPGLACLEARGLPILLAGANCPGECVFNEHGVSRIPATPMYNRLSYVQVFHNGCIEAADTYLAGSSKGTPPIIRAGTFEPRIRERVAQYLNVQRKMHAALPVVVAVSLLNATGTAMAEAPRTDDCVASISLKNVLLPPVMVESWEDDLTLTQVLKPAFDALWNACGYERSQSYDDQGNWCPIRSV